MFRILVILLLSAVLVAQVTSEGANPPPYDVISVAMESETSDPVEARRAYEESRFEAQTLARIAERKAKANKALAALLFAEKAHAAIMFDVVGFRP